MTYRRPAVLRDRISAFLKEHGEHSMREIAEEFDIIEERVQSAIKIARDNYGEEIFYIKRWRKCVGHPGRYTRMWAAGPGRDKKKPPVDVKANRAECNKRYKDKMRGRSLLMARKTSNPWAAILGLAGADYHRIAKAEKS